MQTTNQAVYACLNHFVKPFKNLFKPGHLQQAIAQSNIWATSIKANVICSLIVAGSIVLLSGCQKENITGDILANSAASVSSSAASSTGKLLDVSDYGLPSRKVNYGAFICPPNAWGWLTFQLNVADQLGVSCLRSTTSVPDDLKPNSLLGNGYNVLLNFNTNNDEDEGDGSKSFATNLAKYRVDLTNALLLCPVKPVIAVIENEESNRFFYSGSAWDYIKQLNVAINVMHSFGVEVANGGITDQGLNYLVYMDFLAQGKTDSAEQFRKLENVTPNSPITQERGDFVDSLLQAYNQLDVDYVNFHWKGSSPDVESLREVLDYLAKRCNKPIISNELGQYDKDPNTLLAYMQLCTKMNLPYIVWYSPDENHGRKATPLHYDDGSLTPTGVAYQSFLAQ